MTIIDRKSLVAVVGILKRRFPNLTADETIDLASDILLALSEIRGE